MQTYTHRHTHTLQSYYTIHTQSREQQHHVSRKMWTTALLFDHISTLWTECDCPHVTYYTPAVSSSHQGRVKAPCVEFCLYDSSDYDAFPPHGTGLTPRMRRKIHMQILEYNPLGRNISKDRRKLCSWVYWTSHVFKAVCRKWEVHWYVDLPFILLAWLNRCHIVLFFSVSLKLWTVPVLFAITSNNVGHELMWY